MQRILNHVYGDTAEGVSAAIERGTCKDQSCFMHEFSSKQTYATL